MFINLFNTLKKNLYGVSTDKGEIKFFNSDANINKTSSILIIENKIEFLREKNAELENLIKNYDKKIDLKDFSSIISLILVIASILVLLLTFAIPASKTYLYLFFLGFIGLALVAIAPNMVDSLLGDTRSKIIAKKNSCQEKINKNKELIINLIENSEKEKKKANLYEIVDNDYINNLTIDSLDLNKDNNIKVRKLVKEENKR